VIALRAQPYQIVGLIERGAMQKNVINTGDMGLCRRLLEEIEQVRREILRGEVDGLAVITRTKSGEERLCLRGKYEADSSGALQVALALSLEIVQKNA
jgi:hypothetical protein